MRPPPPMTTGSSRSLKKSSSSASPSELVKLDLRLPLGCTTCAGLRSVLVDRFRLPVLLLRPRRAYLPYPSCPVPAAGPFLGNLSPAGALVASVGVFGFRKNRPKRPVSLLGLAVTGVGMRFGTSSWDKLVLSFVGLVCAADSSDWLEPLSSLATWEVVGSLDGFPLEVERVDGA